jgi:hypothetical protein
MSGHNWVNKAGIEFASIQNSDLITFEESVSNPVASSSGCIRRPNSDSSDIRLVRLISTSTMVLTKVFPMKFADKREIIETGYLGGTQ